MAEYRDSFHSTHQSFEDFLTSTIWHDIKKELSAWIEDINSNLGTADEMMILYRCQGSKEACENLLRLPEQIMEYLTNERDE